MVKRTSKRVPLEDSELRVLVDRLVSEIMEELPCIVSESITEVLREYLNQGKENHETR